MDDSLVSTPRCVCCVPELSFLPPYYVVSLSMGGSVYVVRRCTRSRNIGVIRFALGRKIKEVIHDGTHPTFPAENSALLRSCETTRHVPTPR